MSHRADCSLRFVATVLVAILLVSQWASWAHLANSAERPNVVLIMTDNHGAWTLGCYGNKDIRTPNIDRLAAEGTLFTRAFASNPVCSPTRATCLTGLMPSQHGVHSFLAGGRLQTGPDARCTLDTLTSLPEILSAKGYKCGLVGKWHLGGNMSPQEGLDDYWITMPHGGTSTFYDAKVIEDGEIRNEPEYLTDFWTRHAVDFIDQQADSKDPFFLFLSYNGPYALSRLLLREGKNRHAEYYADKELPSFPREPVHPWQFSNRDYANNPTSIRRVATEVSGVDDGVGKVMQALKSKGLDENTIVVFVADQGWVGGHGGFFGMGDHTRPLTARDGMMQIPMIWRHPNQIQSGKRSSQMIANYDVLPTLLGHMRLEDQMPHSPKSPGEDFSRLLSQDVETTSKPVFYEYENLRCIRTETAKYIHRHPNGPHELYDLVDDPDEFVNRIGDAKWDKQRRDLKTQLDAFFSQYSVPRYNMWRGGTSQVRIHDGIDEEMAQLAAVRPPNRPAEFKPAPIQVPDGYTVELAAAPPLITHPTMGTFDTTGNLYVCNNAGVNLSSNELEEQLPNAIHRLSDKDGDGVFDSFTVFADKMTFPMGGAWHEGSLYVASPPNIWRLTDTDDDGVADERTAIVKQFGYTGNAASIHGCFFGDDGRLYWCDGYHGHEFKDDDGTITSKREGSYIFSCLPDGSDVQLLAGGGMDNPVEVDLTENGDVLGTVNILYTRPRVDCLVHWLHGGAYPHRERVLNEIKTTGNLLGPVHRFGHVAISGLMRYRSGVIDHQWKNDWFATFFNQGKVVRMDIQPSGSTWQVAQHEFLSSTSREFHPTDVIEDADGSLLVIDTGGWFYRGCPTSQFAKPDVLGAIYRIKRNGMTSQVDPRGKRIDWGGQSTVEMTRLLNDTRFEVRRQAIDECVRRAPAIIPTLKAYLTRGDIRVRKNCMWALTRLAQKQSTSRAATDAMVIGLQDRLGDIRKLAVRGLGMSLTAVKSEQLTKMLEDDNASVRREAAAALGKRGNANAVAALVAALDRQTDRSEEHAIIYALIEINQPAELAKIVGADSTAASPTVVRCAMIALDQMDAGDLQETDVVRWLNSPNDALQRAASDIVRRHPEWTEKVSGELAKWLVSEEQLMQHADVAGDLIPRLAHQTSVAPRLGALLAKSSGPSEALILDSLGKTTIAKAHASWLQPIRERLSSGETAKVQMAIGAAQHLRSFEKELSAAGENDHLPSTLRFRAMRAGVRATDPPGDSVFELIVSTLADAAAPNEASRMARSVSSLRFSDLQLKVLAEQLKNVSPSQLRELIKPFGRSKNVATIQTFLKAVGNANAFLSLPETELSDVVKRFPKETLEQANGLLDRLKQDQQSRRERLSKMLGNLSSGDPLRGRQVFRSEKAKCSSCHRIGKEGKQVGPDLTGIGANRSVSDLLESIVLPSASIVRDYETYNVLVADGRAVSGLLANETTDQVTIQLSTGEKVPIGRYEIEQMRPNTVSIMPNGLDKALSEQELADVIAFLRNQK